MQAFLFVLRIVGAWFAALMAALVLWRIVMPWTPGWLFGPAIVVVLAIMATEAFTHLRRVRLVAGRPDAEALANRHRRQVELPCAADEAFDLVEAAIRELPHVESVDGRRGSLQLHASLARVAPYADDPGFRPGRRRPQRNQVRAVITPGEGTASATIVCEPDSGAWRDVFLVDHGTNLDNAEAITRALARRMAERRRAEQARERQTATEKALAEARLSLLHAQVEPHFLYNTLASAQLLTRSDPAKADRMLGHLIAYLRRSLPSADNALSTLGEELERAVAYLEILRIRMGERLALQVQVPDALKAVPLPPMMLQTLVENAIKHGLEPETGGGTVWILAREQDARVAITVADDGRGLGGGGNGGTGIGLANVRERLRLAYGDAAGLEVASNFPKGAAATLTVPAAGPAGGALG